jgi:glutathionyl-hydroquinone reductase
MYNCSRCERDFKRYEEYYRVRFTDVALCESCRDEIVNNEFCELIYVNIDTYIADDDGDY